MYIQKDGSSIASVDAWRRLAPPKKSDQWVPGRSAFELARAWCGGDSPAVPTELIRLLETSELTRGLSMESVTPEHRIPFDARSGEPRNADLAIVGKVNGARVALTVEAKADEPFGDSVGETLLSAFERRLTNPRSRGVERVIALAQSLLPDAGRCRSVRDLRYQLLTAVAGTLAFALIQEASAAVLLVHEFATSRTTDLRLERNARDLEAFVRALGASEGLSAGRMIGPLTVPGQPLFEAPLPPLLIGKIRTDLRRVGPISDRT